MSSEWMKVMLDEIARKKAEAEEADAEAALRDEEPVTPRDLVRDAAPLRAPASPSDAATVSPPPDDTSEE